jgi:hypothetical protein
LTTICIDIHAIFLFSLSVISLSRWNLIASSCRTPTLVPTVCDFDRTPTKCHPKRGLGRSFQSKALKRPEVTSLNQPKQPPNHKKSQSLIQQRQKPEDPESHMSNQQPRWRLSPQTRPNKTPSNHSIKRLKLKRISSKTQKKRSKQSSKMNWHTSARRINVCDSCKNS